MKKCLMSVAGFTMLLLVSGCAKNPPVNSYTPACYDQIVRAWDGTKWVKSKKPVCTLGNIY